MSERAPRVSVVLVVHRDQAWVRECVTSVLGQSFSDVELVAVDDASPDHAPGILDELAAGDERMTVLHLGEVVPLGQARERGLAAATGDYVWFLSPTEQVAPDALAAIDVRLTDTGADVLVVDQTILRVGQRRLPGPHRELLRTGRGKVGPVSQRPALLDAAIGLCDKLIRRGLIEELGLRFGSGGSDELTVTYPALLAAQRVATDRTVGCLRWLVANADDDPAVHGVPADVIGQDEAVLRYADEHCTPRLRRLLPVRIARHGLAVLNLVPEPERERFFGALSELYRRSRRGDERSPGSRLVRLQLSLLTRDDYRGYGWLQRRSRGRLDQLPGLPPIPRPKKHHLARGARRRLGAYYRAQRRQPLDPDLALFASYWYRDYACSPRAIFEQARELAPTLHSVWAVEADAVSLLPEGVEHVVVGTREYYRALARATYFVNNVNFPDEYVKREGTIHVQTHHGVPLKKMGVDRRSSEGRARSFNVARLLRRCARWDYVVTAGPHDTLTWERAYPVPFTTLEVGYPRDDVLVTASAADIAEIRASLGIAPGQRAVLYAPTHREYDKTIITTLDVARLADALPEDHVLLARPHLFRAGEFDSSPSSRLIDVSRYRPIESLLLAADVLVTDYSSVMFDYVVLDRPIVVHAPDWDDYRTLRGTYFDLLADPPGVVTTTEDDIVAALTSGTADSPDAAAARARFAARFSPHADGRSAERCVRAVWPDRVSGPPEVVGPTSTGTIARALPETAGR